MAAAKKNPFGKARVAKVRAGNVAFGGAAPLALIAEAGGEVMRDRRI